MRFLAAHKLATYAMVSASILALILSGEIGTIVPVLAVGGAIASWFWEAPRVRPERWAGAWNILAILALAFTVVDVAGGGAILMGFARLLLFLLIAKLFSRVTPRDDLWLFVLSFALLVGGAAISSSLSYAVCFLAFVVASTWAAILFHLRRELEENLLQRPRGAPGGKKIELDRALRSRRIVGPAFFGATGVVSLAIFLSSTVLFLLFPRVGFGLFFSRQRSGIQMAGFSDGVSLGGHGLIRDDPTVVMRVKMTGADPRQLPAIHWRGVAFDKYAGGKWSRGMAAPGTRCHTSVSGGMMYVGLEEEATPEKDRRRPTKELIQEIYLEPLDTSALFAASRPMTYEIKLPDLRRGYRCDRGGKNDEVRFPHEAGIRYVVRSDAAPPPRARLAAANDVDPDAFEPYLTLPPELPPRVVELAREITGEATTPLAKVEAVERYLGTFEYTLREESDDQAEPLDYFLFERKKGHCEYFSTAMAVLLRAAGVPTRNVNGFLGGEWNEYGGYLAVRSGDAHSWVEVWFDGVGWVTRDPTPPGSAGPLDKAGGGLFDRMRLLMDTLRLTYFKWVLEYDLFRQLGAMRSLGRAVGDSATKLRGAMKGVRDGAKAAARPLAFATIGGALVVAAWMAWRRRGVADPGSRDPVARAWAAATRGLARRGHRRGEATTPREHARALAVLDVPGAAAYAELTELAYAAWYRAPGSTAPPPSLERARALLREIDDASRRRVPAR